VRLENQIAAGLPDLSVWITPIGGVGIYPAMVTETDQAVVAFEITSHEWSHHYLSFFPLGLSYFSSPDARIINEQLPTFLAAKSATGLSNIFTLQNSPMDKSTCKKSRLPCLIGGS